MPLGVDPVELLAALVAAPSPNPPGDERAVAGVITDALNALGLPAPLVIGKSAERPNLLVRIDGTGPRLMLAGHLDTMPAGNLGILADTALRARAVRRAPCRTRRR